MEEVKPSYYAVIPADVRYDDTLPPNAKLLYGEVAALIGKDGFCFASNQYFAEVFKFSITSVTRLLTQLEKGGYIHRSVVKDKEGKVVQRKIYLSVSMPRIQPPTNFDGTPHQSCGEGTPKIGGYTDTSITDIEKENKKEKVPGKKAKASSLEDSQLKELAVAWIGSVAPESWGRADKNQLFASLMAFYAPRDSARETPKRSKAGFTGLTNKLLRLSGGELGQMLDLLDTATGAGWKSVYPSAGKQWGPPKQTEEEGKVWL